MAGLLSLCFAISCRKEEKSQPIYEYKEDPLYSVAINFNTVSNRDATSPVIEKIKTFRLIITSYESLEGEAGSNAGSGTVETVQLNKVVTEESLASTFDYYLLWYTNKGTKNFYLFANEESVGPLSYSNTGYAETNLSAILNSYTVGSDASGLKSILTSAYFTPEYEPDASSGSIYLPYTSIYEGIEIRDNNESYRMYLVPVATKFIFKFINYRPSEVYVNGISVNSINTDSYLIANVGDGNMTMTLLGETSSLYWVDWLAKVSALSQGNAEFGPNQSFNTLYGWIWDYNIPTSKVNEPYVFVASDTQLQIEGLSYYKDNTDNTDDGEEATGIPGTYTAGPFYVPESKVNVFEEANASGIVRQIQKYYLTIGLGDSDPENNDVPEFSEVEIDNLKALFRNTSVVITLVMRQGDVEIYAQIAPWTEQQSFGYVNEGNKPGFLNRSDGI